MARKVSKQTSGVLSRLRVVVQNASVVGAVPSARKLSRWLERSLGDEASGELAIRIVDETESADLNLRYRNKSGATNVLSFTGTEPSSSLGEEDRVLGDLVICAPVVAREADAQGKPLDAHWAHIVLHGTLHLLGYDHESNADAEIMERRERELLSALGFDDPYADVR